MLILSSCDVFLAQEKDAFECESHLEEVYAKTPLNNFEQTKFKDLLENRFPKFKEMFEKASEETLIDTDLLAAISFQESQWDPKAKSNMGVRGMMMVTLETAAIVGVEKRLNPEQNIMGGAKYLAMLQERNIYGKTTADQLSISLAKYNLGPTNIINIAKEIGKEPDEITWPDLEDKLKNIRVKGGLAPFPSRNESEYDAFGTGHSSTSISAALGMAVANQIKKQLL